MSGGWVGRLVRGVRAGRVVPDRGWGARLRWPGSGAGTEDGAGNEAKGPGARLRRPATGAAPPGDARAAGAASRRRARPALARRPAGARRTRAERTAAGADAWRYGGVAFGLLLHLGCVAYAARHVSPAALGAYAVALTAVHLLVQLAGTGVAASLHRAEALTRPTVHAALRLAGLTGFAGFAVAQVAAPLPAVLLHTPDTTPLLRLLACSFLCHPAAEAALAALHRAGHARAAVLTDAGGQAGGVGTGVLLLAAGVNPLGLAAVLPASAALTLGAAGLLLFRTPLPDGTGAAPVRAAALVRVSRFAAAFGLLRLVTAGAPLWAVCRLLGPGAAGVYSRAAVLCEVPVPAFGRTPYQGQGREVRSLLDPGGVHGRDRERERDLDRDLDRGLGDEPEHGPETGHHPRPDRGPAPARPRRRPRRVDVPAARLALTGASAAAFAGFGAAAGVGPAALAVLLGPGWESATGLVPWLCAAAALQLVYSAGCSLDLARGRRRALLGTHLVVLVTTAAALALVLPWRGSGHALPLFACAAAAGPAAGHALQLVRWGRCGLVRVGEVLRAHAVHAGIGAAAGALATLAGSTAAEPGPALLYGLLALAPVALLCAALHEQLPLSAALAGQRTPPAPAPRPRTPDRAPTPRRAPRAPVP